MQRRIEVIKFPTIIVNSEGVYLYGPEAHIDPSHVVAIEPKQNRYHSFRPAQNYATVHLSTGGTINVFQDAEAVVKTLDKARGLGTSTEAIANAMKLAASIDPEKEAAICIAANLPITRSDEAWGMDGDPSGGD